MSSWLNSAFSALQVFRPGFGESRPFGISQVSRLDRDPWDELVEQVKFCYPIESSRSELSERVEPITCPIENLVRANVDLVFHRYLIQGAANDEFGPLAWLSDCMTEFSPPQKRSFTYSVCNEIISSHRASISHLEQSTSSTRSSALPLVARVEDFSGSLEQEGLRSVAQDSESEFRDLCAEEVSVLQESLEIEHALREYYREHFREIPQNLIRLFEAKALIDYEKYSLDFRDRHVENEGNSSALVEPVFHPYIVKCAIEEFLKEHGLFKACYDPMIEEKLNAFMRFGFSEKEAFSHICNLFLSAKLLENLNGLNQTQTSRVHQFSVCLKSSISKHFLSSRISSFHSFHIPLGLQDSSHLSVVDAKSLTKNLFLLEKVFLPRINLERRVLVDFWKVLKSLDSLDRDYRSFAAECEMQAHKIEEKHDVAEGLILNLRKKLTPTQTAVGAAFRTGRETCSKTPEFWKLDSACNQIYKKYLVSQ